MTEFVLQKPSIGRIVHVVFTDGVTMAAIITGVNDDGTIDVVAFERQSFHFFHEVAAMGKSSDELSWIWPPRVGA